MNGNRMREERKRIKQDPKVGERAEKVRNGPVKGIEVEGSVG